MAKDKHRAKPILLILKARILSIRAAFRKAVKTLGISRLHRKVKKSRPFRCRHRINFLPSRLR
jgi:hypothetical protein